MRGRPDFVIAGAHKCGTSTIMEMVQSHSQVARVPVEEPHTLIQRTFGQFDAEFRSRAFIESFDEYASMHDTALLSGDASVLYLAHADEFLSNLVQVSGGADIPVLVCLRNPVDRAWSAFNYARMLNQLESLHDFESALAADQTRWADPLVPSSLCYVTLGCYSQSVRTLKSALGERLKVLLFEDFVEEPSSLLLEVFDHFGLPAEHVEAVHANVGGRWRSPIVGSLARSSLARSGVRWTRRRMPAADGWFARVQERGTVRVELNEDLRRRTARLFESDVTALEEVLGRNLDRWKV